MSRTRPLFRTAALTALAAAVVATAGCGWFRKGSDLYAQSPENRPLEVPPDLDLPSTDSAMALPEGTSSVTRSSVGAGSSGPAVTSDTGFNVSGDRDEIFTRVGEVLATIPGVQIASSAQLLGTYDISYEGSDFLVRVAKSGDGAYISAVDPRGLPAAGEAPAKLIAALRGQVGG